MQPFGKRGLTAAAVAVTLGLAAFGGSLVTASAALANAPGGVACAPSDGKIDGYGSTYQTNAQALWWPAYGSEICGSTTNTPADVAGGNMGIYNFNSSFTGSGSGIIGANCRSAAYQGTDLPYNEAQLTALDGAPGNTTASLGLSPCPTTTALAAPFAPDATTNTSGFPNSNDATGNMMSFPIAGSAEALLVNLTAAQCTAGTPSNLQFTPSQVDGILGGSILMWNSSLLTVNNPSLSTCSTAITRVVRFDNSGTTSILKTYLNDIDPTRTGAAVTCDPGTGTTPWITIYNQTPNTNWPSGGSSCSPLAVPTTKGGPALITLLNSTPGGIGYADLSDAVNLGGSDLTASVQNAAGTNYIAPGNGTGANCDLSTLSEPGNGASTAMVGLVSNDNWGSDNATVNGTGQHDDASDTGVQYPICGLTYDLVYTGLHGAVGTGPVSSLTADQRRTLYSYFTFVLSSLGQSILPNNNYASLPLTWTPAILAGFQKNF